ncbi:helix-turn-helix transcriptional regulator [Brevibacillus parabrevis]|uniref:helix-turn-helix domain-containing protein n=1 Tax=Brevibacillus parabrevis TaxID=54914 RepID=UPI0028D24C17|nr:helix-turn-helix transcriptional regulator [Brevibacillus parabrevis]
MGQKYIEIGKTIARIRKDKGLSLENVASVAGIHRTTVGLIERGEREPTINTAAKIASALGLTLIELLQLAEKEE